MVHGRGLKNYSNDHVDYNGQNVSNEIELTEWNLEMLSHLKRNCRVEVEARERDWWPQR